VRAGFLSFAFGVEHLTTTPKRTPYHFLIPYNGSEVALVLSQLRLVSTKRSAGASPTQHDTPVNTQICVPEQWKQFDI